CRLGVDVAKYRPSGEPKADFVVAVGTIQHAKGVDRAIHAVSVVPRARRPELVWIANAAVASYVRECRELAARLDVRFSPRDNISDEEVISLLSRARCMLYAPRLEPFGLAPLEANACGTAVVGIAEGGLRESIADGVNGVLVEEDDPKRLAAALERLL